VKIVNIHSLRLKLFQALIHCLLQLLWRMSTLEPWITLGRDFQTSLLVPHPGGKVLLSAGAVRASGVDLVVTTGLEFVETRRKVVQGVHLCVLWKREGGGGSR
jgi:hypothetical protein